MDKITLIKCEDGTIWITSDEDEIDREKTFDNNVDEKAQMLMALSQFLGFEPSNVLQLDKLKLLNKKISNWKITMNSQNVKFDYVCNFTSKEEATKFAEENNWVYIDENEFEWLLEVEEEEKRPQIMRPLTQQILDRAYEDWKELKSVIEGKDCTLETLCDELNGCNCYENHFDCNYNSIGGVTIFKEPNGFKVCDTAEIWNEEYFITEYNFARMENNKNKSALEQYADKQKVDKSSSADKER